MMYDVAVGLSKTSRIKSHKTSSMPSLKESELLDNGNSISRCIFVSEKDRQLLSNRHKKQWAAGSLAGFVAGHNIINITN